MGSRRDQWPPVVAGSAIPWLYRLADGGDALGGTTATARSSTSVKSTRTQPASKGRPRPPSTRTITHEASSVVAATPAGHALGGGPSGGCAFRASQRRLVCVVSSARAVFPDE